MRVATSIFLSLLFITNLSFAQIFQQDCNPSNFEVDALVNDIHWTQFPDFTLPFTVVYHGKVNSDSLLYPLQKGFSHIASKGTSYKDTLWPSQRAYTWTGIAGADNWAQNTSQPWRLKKIPWGNDIEGYRTKWWNRLNWIQRTWYKYQPENGPKLDLVIADLEWAHHSDANILSIKNDSLVPEQYRQLSDSLFIIEYQKAMTELYASSMQLAKDSLHQDSKISSYAETPIRRTWWSINSRTWDDWKSNLNHVDYLVKDSTGKINSSFFNFHDFISPSVYNFYNADSNSIGNQYLAYNLFSMEANAAWTNKDQLVYVWLNYHNCCSNLEAIQAWMAEATGIFPFMNGAKGVYPWIPAAYDTYEYFIYGLYRLSKYKDFFDGNQLYYRPESAHASFVNKTPIWRGVYNDDKLLVAAHNPYADHADTTILPIQYGEWEENIALLGKEVFLCSFDLSTSKTNEPSYDHLFSIYPVPTENEINIDSKLANYHMLVTDAQGRVILQKKNLGFKSKIDLSHCAKGSYVIRIFNSAQAILNKKIIKL